MKFKFDIEWNDKFVPSVPGRRLMQANPYQTLIARPRLRSAPLEIVIPPHNLSSALHFTHFNGLLLKLKYSLLSFLKQNVNWISQDFLRRWQDL